jgi:hypothetical protein
VHFDGHTYKLKFTGPINDEELVKLKEALEGRERIMRMIDEQRADADEAAREGCPYSPKDLEIISHLENCLAIIDDALE